MAGASWTFPPAPPRRSNTNRAALSGSDDRKLLATLRVDGQPAELGDFAYSPTRLAEQRELAPAAAPDREAQRTALAEQIEAQRQAMSSPSRPRENDAQAEPPLPPESPQRVALAELIEHSAAPLPKNPPLPPQRPFDLGTIPGADVPISVARR
jgi:rare lipoprotein A